MRWVLENVLLKQNKDRINRKSDRDHIQQTDSHKRHRHLIYLQRIPRQPTSLWFNRSLILHSFLQQSLANTNKQEEDRTIETQFLVRLTSFLIIKTRTISTRTHRIVRMICGRALLLIHQNNHRNLKFHSDNYTRRLLQLIAMTIIKSLYLNNSLHLSNQFLERIQLEYQSLVGSPRKTQLLIFLQQNQLLLHQEQRAKWILKLQRYLKK